MASISSPGIGSGLNVNQLVSQLVAAERAPEERRLQRVETEARADLNAFATLRSALSALRSAHTALTSPAQALPGRRTTVEANAGFTASADGNAAVGRYRIEVAALATAQRQQSAAVAATADLGGGSLSFTVAGETFAVSLGGSNTITQVRDAINAATGGRGLAATVVNGDAGSVLVLSAARSGTGNAISVNASGSIATFTAGLVVTTPAADAVVRVDGVSRSAPENRLTDLITGVTLDLTRAAPASVFSLDINADPGNVRTALQGFVAAYNTALGALRNASAFNAETRQGGPLLGDAAVRGLVQQLRGAVGDAFGPLSTLGVRGSKDGSLNLDAARLDAALASDPSAVRRLFDPAQLGSLGQVLGQRLEGAVAANSGTIDQRTRALNDRIRGLDSSRERLDARIDRVEQSLRRQFNALDGLVAQLQTTQSFLTQQLNRFAQTG